MVDKEKQKLSTLIWTLIQLFLEIWIVIFIVSELIVLLTTPEQIIWSMDGLDLLYIGLWFATIVASCCFIIIGIYLLMSRGSKPHEV